MSSKKKVSKAPKKKKSAGLSVSAGKFSSKEKRNYSSYKTKVLFHRCFSILAASMLEEKKTDSGEIVFIEKKGQALSSSSTFPVPYSLETRSFARSFLGNHEYYFMSGTYSRFSTSVATVCTLPDVGSSTYLSAVVTSTTAPELPFFQGLFDEFKIAGITVHYIPFNPYNRGVAVASDAIIFYWDDDTNTPTNLTTAGQIGSVSHRVPLFHIFTPDHEQRFTFMRPNPMSQYPWSDCASPGGQTSSQGGMGWGSNATTMTASTQYGSLTYSYFFMLRARI